MDADIASKDAAVQAALTEAASAVERTLDRLFPVSQALHGRVAEAMRYALFAGGKRLRPFLVLQSARLFGAAEAGALRAAAAMEALHTYSLVHDDLPCMDDDDLRRGQPTTHKKFDEATAVLAGDGLLTAAFGILADPETHPSADVRCRLVARLAEAAGADGMIGGQMIDIEAPNHDFGEAEVMLLQRLKTGALFEFACEAGAILGEAGTEAQKAMRSYAQDLGLAFQIADDLIDAGSTAEAAGKAVGKDAAAGKATFISLRGKDGARAEAERLSRRAAETLSVFGPKADILAHLPLHLLGRAA